MSKQMTWAELVAWAKARGWAVDAFCATSEYAKAYIYIRGQAFGHISAVGRTVYGAKRNLCRAVSAIREAK